MKTFLAAGGKWRSSALIATVLLRGATVFASAVFAVSAGPTGFAPVALLLVMTPLATMISTWGVDQQIFRSLVHSPQRALARGTALRAISVPLASLPLIGVVAGLVGYLFSYSFVLFLVAGVAAGAQGFSLLIVSSYLRARTESFPFLLLYGVTAGTALGSRIIALYLLHASPTVSWVVGDVASATVAVIVAGWWLWLLKRSPEGVSLSYREMLNFGVPMTAHGFFQWALGSSDRVVLGMILGPASLGTYGAVYQFSGLFNVAASEINKTGLHRYAGKGVAHDDIARRDRKLFIRLWLAGIAPVVIALILLQRSGYPDAVALGIALYVSFLPLVIYLPIANLATISHGRPKLMSLASGLGALTNIAVNAGTGRVLGLYAGALANSLGFIVMALCLAGLSRSRRIELVTA